MPTSARVEDAFNFAKFDAASRGLKAVGQDNLFVGLLHEAGMTVAILADAGVDLSRLRKPIRDRIDALMVKLPEEMTANPEVSAILMDARTLAEQRKHEFLAPVHVFYALIQRASRGVLDMIENAGGSKEKLVERIERTLQDF
jgi:ATP-dependent Clp protease ATP-binding subunit ClpA